VDDTPAPLGKPLDVLTRPEPRAAIAPAPPPPAADPVAPSRPTNGLLRVVAPVPGPLAPALSHKPLKIQAAATPPHPKPAAPAARVEAAKLEAPKLQKAVLKARRDKRRVHETEVAQSAPAKPRHALSAIAHAFAKLAPHHAKPEPVQRAQATPPRRKNAAPRLAAAEPRRARPQAAAPIRVANVQTRCASPDPGEALACGDPGLSAAERRLNRAYRDAEAAGVPASTLERQQQRWRAARAAAAREAPWAVRQVYQARIAELQDLTHDARGD
jgi:uncharacterized protein YecT (DUF1311 family)